MFRRTAVLALVAFSVVGTAAHADEGKDESGKGKEQRKERKRLDEGDRRDKRDRGDERSSYFRQRGHNRIPDGHLPPPGECRIWYPDRPAGHQPPPFKCGEARRRVEPGGWYISPGSRPQEVEVAVYDARRPGIVIDVGIFDARTGSMIRIVGAK